MSSARSARRFRMVVTLSLASFMALGSLWVNMVIKRSAPGTPTPPRSEPDYHVENFNFIKMSPTGQPRYHLHGKKMTHHPQEDSFFIEQPVMQNLDEKKPPQTMRSDTALVEEDATKLHMYDNVHIDRPASPLAESFHLSTQYLLIFPEDDIAKTDKPVTIHRGNSVMTGVGMFVNNTTREMRLLSDVKVMIAPKEKATR
ncbi:MAG: LPS export ABC transporter periplasmic protein LptC [Burkholderiaceae bacterium]|nr:LPS export ABC transporter periplasmic protein LptC [Burkholderiaceae bacterium]